MGRSQPFGVVVVGAGLMGRWHAHAASRSGGRILNVVDPDLSRARALANRYAGCGATTSLDAALSDSRPQTVHLCTPTDTHEVLTRQALEAGCHVLVEKPLAPTLATTRELLDLASARRLLLCPVHQFIFQRGMLRTSAWLSELGDVRHIDTVICSAGAEGLSPAGRDQVAIDVLPHPLSLLARLLGQRFRQLAWHLDRPADGELRLSGSASGVSAGVLVSMSGRPTMNLLRVIAERGCVHGDLFHGFATIERGSVSRAHKTVRPFAVSGANLVAAAANLTRRVVSSEYAYPGLTELVGRFAKAVAEGGASPVSAEETLAVAEARDAIVALADARSARTLV
jgi:predicted dehydrogenase